MLNKIAKRKGFLAKLLLVAMLVGYFVPFGPINNDARADYLDQGQASSSNSSPAENEESNTASGSNISIGTLNLIDDRSFKVSFYNLEEGSQPILVRYVINGEYISETEVPSIPDDYKKFDGWVAEGESEPYDFAGRPVTGDLKLYARFGDYVTVTYRENGTVFKVMTVEKDTVLSDPDLEIEPDGNQIFTGNWFVEGDLSSSYVFGSQISEDITLVPERVFKWIVQFDTIDGTIEPTQYIDEGAKITEPGAPGREGYTFLHWEHNGSPYDFNQPVTGNIELVAKYNPELVKYTVMYMVEKEGKPLDFASTAGADDLANYQETLSYEASGLTGTPVTDLTESDFTYPGNAVVPNYEINYLLRYYSDQHKIVYSNQEIQADGGLVVYVLHTRRILNLEFVFRKIDGYTIHGTIGSGADKVVLDGEEEYTHTIQAKVGMEISSMTPNTMNEEGKPGFVYRDSEGNDVYAIVSFLDKQQQGFDHFTKLAQNMLYYSGVDGVADTYSRKNYNCRIDILRNYRNINYIESLDQTSDAGTEPIVGGELANRIKIKNYIAYSNGEQSFADYIYFDLSGVQEARPSDPLSYPFISETAAYTGFGDNYYNYTSYWYPYGYGRADGSQVFYQTKYPEVGDDRYLIYLRNSFPLNFVNTGHNDIASKSVKYYDVLDNYMPKLSELGVGANEVFEGWYLEPELINKVVLGNSGTRMPAGQITLYAKYVSGDYRVVFRNSHEGTIVSDARYGRGTEVPASVIADDFYDQGLFLGWYYMDDQTMVPYDWSTKVYSDMDIFAVWDGNAYQLIYHANGKTGAVPVDSNHYIGGVYALVKQGNHLSDAEEVFIGWYDSESDQVYYPGNRIKIIGNMELKAVYAPRDKSVTLQYLNDDGSELGTVSYLKNESLTLSNITSFGVSKEGYDFIGWKAEDGTLYKLGKEYLIDQDEKVIAVWKQKEPPTDPTNPTDPTDPTDPTNPTDPTKPTKPGGGGGGGEDPKPTSPTNPPAPTDPTGPTESESPTITLPAETTPGGNLVIPPGETVIKDPDGNVIWEGRNEGELPDLPPGDYVLTIIGDDGVPLSYYVQIPDDPVAQARLPRTGDRSSNLVLSLVIFLTVIGGTGVICLKRKKDSY